MRGRVRGERGGSKGERGGVRGRGWSEGESVE